MSRGTWTLNKTKVQRAIEGARAAGTPVRTVECKPCGTVLIHLGEPEPTASDTRGDGNEWDNVA